MTYDMSNQMAYMACDHYNVDERKNAYQNAINKTAEWAKSHNTEELASCIADLAEMFPTKNICESLILAGVEL